MQIYDSCEYEFKDGYLSIYPSNSQITFLFEEFHFIMKTLIRKDCLLSNQDLSEIHRLSRMWMELLTTRALTMISREDGLIILKMRRHWGNNFIFDILAGIGADKFKQDGNLIIMADHISKSISQVIDS